MIGTSMIVEMAVGGIAYVASHKGVEIVVNAAVSSVDVTKVGKICVGVSKWALGAVAGREAYKIVTGRKPSDDIAKVLNEMMGPKKEEPTTETTENSTNTTQTTEEGAQA